MSCENRYPLSQYQDVTPLCEKGHVMLVRSEGDGQLYVKKRVQSYDPQLYRQLQKDPVPNTPVIYEVYEGEVGSDLVIIEEYIQGITLAERMEERGLFSERETIDIGLGLCRILTQLHRRRPAVIHRDIKPSNVMLQSDGTVKLVDFSVAKAQSPRQGRDTVLLGTAGFAAPEQYGFFPSSPQSDIYSVGVLLNVMLTGTLPWEQVACGKLRRIIRRCLEVNPRDRYLDVWELYYALKRARRVKSEWLPPGFRTLQPLNILIAVLGYVFLVIFSLRIDGSAYETAAEYHFMRLNLLLLGLFLILFYCNYLDLRRKFLFMRSRHRWLRILGFALAPFFAFWTVLLITVLLKVFFTVWIQ